MSHEFHIPIGSAFIATQEQLEVDAGGSCAQSLPHD